MKTSATHAFRVQIVAMCTVGIISTRAFNARHLNLTLGFFTVEGRSVSVQLNSSSSVQYKSQRRARTAKQTNCVNTTFTFHRFGEITDTL
jgi:hypothetical protein